MNLPLVALTDYDPSGPKEDGTLRKPLGPTRVVEQMLFALLDYATWDTGKFDDLLGMAPSLGIYMNTHTFEVDLFKSGLAEEFLEAMKAVGVNDSMKKRMQEWTSDIDSLDTDQFLVDIESVGKGRFAQRLASIISESSTTACPKYIIKALKYVARKCQRD